MALQLKQAPILAQQLIMTPQLQQAIKLLQLNRIELLETINQEVETNPMLEILEESPSDGMDDGKGLLDGEGSSEQSLSEMPEKEVMKDEIDWDTYFSEYNTGWAEPQFDMKEMPPLENMVSEKESLTSHLMWQLNVSDLTETQKKIGVHIIGNLDPDGYLQISLEELAEITGCSLEEVSETLSLIQNFDPVGVAARDTRECLLIQARFQNLGGTIVEKILLEHMDKLENKKYDLIAKSLSVSLDEVLSAVSVITSFEPKPGRRYSDEETIYITPDIYVFKVGDNHEIVLNEDGLPKLRINSYYKKILSDGNSFKESERGFVQDKLRSAQWLIKSIHQRQQTIYRVTESIVRFQEEFLDKGIAYLKPLVLRDVAEDIQMHESTISRVTANKYVHTPQGVFPLKFFFNSAISSVEGESVASETVKEHIRKIIKSENKAKPYSDQEIAAMLKKLNIDVARRTVAKYRESMGILPSRKRRKPC
ncbi:MAG: RNA polymerase factor sigma-54 [Deltaproteobacteria bacterium]|nr:RNA polymerase factor sigma-54 [Deltaproteobacteria bacterium]